MIKKINLISLMLFTWVNYAQVGININTPDASSALDIESTTGGILIPRMTEAQRDAIVLPALGLMIYQMDEISGFYFYDGNAWTKINGSNATITAGTGVTVSSGKVSIGQAVGVSDNVTFGEVSATTFDIGGADIASTAAELNILDGGTTASTVTLSGTDGIVINDDGVMKQALVSDISTYTNNWTTSVFVNAGVDVTLGDLKVRMTNSDDLKRKSLEISTNNISNTYNVYGSAVYTKNGSISGKTIKNILPLNITHHYQFLHDAEEGNLGYGGDTATWLLMDTSKEIAWRITLIVGGGYSNNFISIERLH
jgi:hypothetical protein